MRYARLIGALACLAQLALVIYFHTVHDRPSHAPPSAAGSAGRRAHPPNAASARHGGRRDLAAALDGGLQDAPLAGPNASTLHATADTAASSFPHWLCCIMPSAPRKIDCGRAGNSCASLAEDPSRAPSSYLERTLDSLLAQMPSSADGALGTQPPMCVAVFRAGNQSAPHPAWERARARYAPGRHPLGSAVYWLRRLEGERAAVRAPRQPPIETTPVQRQTADVSRMLLAFDAAQLAPFVALLEDDWLACPGAVGAMAYAVAKASLYAGRGWRAELRRPAWAAVRVSYGLNGVILHGGADVRALAQFLGDPAALPDNALPKAPPDHLAYRWLRSKYRAAAAHHAGRRIHAFRWSLFFHIGDSSSIGGSAARHKTRCWHRLQEWLFEQERFHEGECPHDDIWPCTGAPWASDAQPDGTTGPSDRANGTRAAALARLLDVSGRALGAQRTHAHAPAIDWPSAAVLTQGADPGLAWQQMGRTAASDLSSNRSTRAASATASGSSALMSMMMPVILSV